MIEALTNPYVAYYITSLILLTLIVISLWKNKDIVIKWYVSALFVAITITLLTLFVKYIPDLEKYDSLVLYIFTIIHFLGIIVHVFSFCIVINIVFTNKKYINIFTKVVSLFFVTISVMFILFAIYNPNYNYTSYSICNENIKIPFVKNNTVKYIVFEFGHFTKLSNYFIPIYTLILVVLLVWKIIANGLNTQARVLGLLVSRLIYISAPFLTTILPARVQLFDYYNATLNIALIFTSIYISSNKTIKDFFPNNSGDFSHKIKNSSFIQLYVGITFLLIIIFHIFVTLLAYNYTNKILFGSMSEAFYIPLVISLIFVGILSALLKSMNHTINDSMQCNYDIEHATDVIKKADSIKSVFLATLSHEVRTPLNGILGIADVLKTETKNKKTLDNANIILQSGNNLMNIINDILIYSKIEHSGLTLNKSSFNLRSALLNEKKFYNYNINNTDIDFSINFNSNVPELIYSDKEKLIQIVRSLVNNAIKFSPKGFVKVYVYSTKVGLFNEISIKITDSGIGIKKEILDKIFDKFHQGDTSNTRKFGGTGLGLSIAKKLSQHLGGNISVISEEGKGSEFTFTFKYNPNNIKQLKKVIEFKENTDFEKLFPAKILIADDNKVNILLIKKQLEKLGYKNIETAQNGKQAVDKCSDINSNFNLIFMDINMPEMDGFEAIELITSLKHNNAKITAITANDLQDVKDKLNTIGVYSYLNKPFSIKKLMEAISILR
ncbi:MAG: response regulator [Ichthyobacteriaceae bacterium]|nr:response regulator [Ichthyobacteriaceae bacterium]